MVVDSSQNVQVIVDLYDTRIEKTIGFSLRLEGLTEGTQRLLTERERRLPQ